MNYLVEGAVDLSMIGDGVNMTETQKQSGGHSVFLGMVRADEHEGERVVAIEYSAYEPMVRSEADRIRNEIMSRYNDVTAVEISHSTGIVKAGEISLAVVVSAGHRRQAIDACSECVELIKQRLPVWKKEIYSDNTHIWQGNS